MGAIKSAVEFVELESEGIEPECQIQDLADHELVLVGGGTGDVII
jgi:hypothetical protein